MEIYEDEWRDRGEGMVLALLVLVGKKSMGNKGRIFVLEKRRESIRCLQHMVYYETKCQS